MFNPSSSSSSKNHSKKSSSGRDRDKSKSVASESGGSSQCDTPPLTEKDGAGPSQGKFAGIGPDSVQCMAEQVGAEINLDAVTNLAEDVSYKLRQTIATIALHSAMMKKCRVDSWDVNSVLMLSDTSPVVGTTTAPYTQFGDDKMCCQVDNLLNITDIALLPQTYAFSNVPTVSVEWITDEKSLNNNNNISVNLQNYYTKVARALLSIKKKPKELAVQDLKTNTRIGPIFPNLFNLAVLVLNDDNLNALKVPAKKPLQSNVLDMVDALCSNPCSLDTNIQKQFQRLFPVMVSNILGNGSLVDKMVSILTKITRTWPSFIEIGKGILLDYLSQGTKERITAAMVRCVAVLGRRALVQCVEAHLDHLAAAGHANLALLDAATCLLRSEPTTHLEDFVMTDYTIYEMLGDAILPRRTLFPYAGGCKHAAAVLLWLHRRSEEPSVTSVDCYWKKSRLTECASSKAFITCKEMGEVQDYNTQHFSDVNILSDFIDTAEANGSEASVLRYYQTQLPDLNIHKLCSTLLGKLDSPQTFLQILAKEATPENIQRVFSTTKDQSDSPLWFEMRYGRITGSIVHEAAHCKTMNGSLLNRIMGEQSKFNSLAMARGKKLEKDVIKVVSEKMKTKIEDAGLLLSAEYPILGATPDGITEDYTIEVKCPSTQKTVQSYVKNDNISLKCWSQMQTQMYFSKKRAALFCIAHPDFEDTKNVDIYYVPFDDSIVCVLNKATEFWVNSVFPKLKEIYN